MTDVNKIYRLIGKEGRTTIPFDIRLKMRIGYNRAARLIEMMEDDGIVGPPNGSKPREIIDYTK